MAEPSKLSTPNIEDLIGDIDSEVINNEISGIDIKRDTDNDDFENLLNEFINQELADIEERQEDLKEAKHNDKPSPTQLSLSEEENAVVNNLYEEERALYDAYRNFSDTVRKMGRENNLNMPEFLIKPEMLYLRYKPKIGKFFTADVLSGWDIMIACHSQRLKSLNASAKDEEILEFAEKTTDETLQLALISYVEVLIEIEGCELAYNMRKAKARKHRIEKRIYEEHQKRKEKMQKFIAAIAAQNFPIDAERLVTNYFKTAQKDADGAYKILISNPATYAPIDVSKIPPRLFGLIKSKPEDGIRINKEIGEFIKKLKI